MNVNLDQKASRFKGMLSVKFSDESLAQKSSIFEGALSVKFGDVNISGPCRYAWSTKSALSKSWPNKQDGL